MIINIAYQSSKNRKKDINSVLGIKNSRRDIYEYDGMLISYNKNLFQINTLLSKNIDLDFLIKILNVVFKNETVGISGIANKDSLLGVQNVKIYWS
ncbi:MAG: hypothetical protein IJA07_02770 [Agathobacter sp.]|nr:hypothetical protein [Agathobacter sp.]